MDIYLILWVCRRMFGFNLMINRERPDLNYGWTYVSFTLHFGHSTLSNGWEIIRWNRKPKLRTEGWNITQVKTKGEY